MPHGTIGLRRNNPESIHTTGVVVLDVIFVAVTIASFALLGLIAKGVEKL